MGGFLKGQHHAGLNIVAFARGVGPGTGAPAAKTAKAAETAAEQVAENIAKVHAAKPGPAETAAVFGGIVRVHAGKTKLVVPFALFRVGEDVVRLVDLLKLFLCGFIAGVQVRVVLFGELAVGALDFGVACIFADTQHLVIVSLVCHRITPYSV